MKTAKQLREIALNYNSISLATIEHQCTKAAENGATSIMIFDRFICEADLLILEEKGITVSQANGVEGFYYELDWNL